MALAEGILWASAVQRSRKRQRYLALCRGRSSPLWRLGAAGRDVRERRLTKFRQNVARFRLYRLRFLQENTRSAAFFKIYQILKLNFLKLNFDKILQILRHLQLFC